MKQKIFKHCIMLMTSYVVASVNRIKSSAKQRKGERGEDLRSTDTDTATGIRHGETRGHGKFQKMRIRIRQGHGII